MSRGLGSVVFVFALPCLAGPADAELEGTVEPRNLPATRSSTAATEVLVVTGSRAARRAVDSPLSVRIIDRLDIERSGARDLAEALETKPGLRVIPDVTGGVQVQLRGFDTDHVLVLMDGQRLSGRKNGAVDLSRLPVETIERIEVLEGPASAAYGADALAGVINVITRAPSNTLEGSLRASYGAAPAPEADTGLNPETLEVAGRLAGRIEDLGLQGVASYRRRSPYDLTPETPGQTGSGFDDAALQLGGRHEGSDGSVLVRLDGGLRTLNGVESGPELPSGQRAIYDREQQIHTLNAYVMPRLELGSGALVFRAAHSLYTETFVRQQRGGSDRLDEHFTDAITELSVQLEQTLFDTHEAMIGVDGLHQAVDATRYPSFEDRVRIAGFLQDEWTPLPELSVLAGMRVDVDNQFGTYPTPRLALRVSPLPGTDRGRLQLRASWGLGFKAPLPRDTAIYFDNPSAGYLVRGNPELDPERASTFDVGVDFTPVKQLALRLTAFRSDLDNLIVIAGGTQSVPGEPVEYTYDNVRRARIQGMSASLSYRPLPALDFAVSWDGLDAADLELDRPLPDRAPHRFTGAVSWSWFEIGLDTTVSASWTDARHVYLAQTSGEDLAVRVAPYLRLDARAALELSTEFEAFVGGDNLTNAGDSEYLPLPPRTLYAGIQSRFP